MGIHTKKLINKYIYYVRQTIVKAYTLPNVHK